MYELEEIARLFLAGESESEIVATVKRALPASKRTPKWLPRLAQRYIELFRTRPRHREVVDFLSHDTPLRKAVEKITLPRIVRTEPSMRPLGHWSVPAIVTVDELADWLGIRQAELEWFADLAAFQTSAKLSHYRYRTVPKRDGASRILEVPKPRIKAMQRKILSEILDVVPAHFDAHGFVRNKSIQTFAAPHTGQDVVLRLDLSNFFPSVSGPRVQALFRIFGYPEPVADLLGGICTNAVPFAIARQCRFEDRAMYTRPHLPQGAPTSPALANRVAYRMDCRLRGLAESRRGVYTRYADDLAFSGGADFARGIERFATHVAAIVHEEGFAVNHRKTRAMRQGVRQHLAGLVTNVRTNIPRDDFDTLKAILTNCVRSGPEGQNRDALPHFQEHLAGRVAFVSSVNAARGARLRELFLRIEWGS